MILQRNNEKVITTIQNKTKMFRLDKTHTLETSHQNLEKRKVKENLNKSGEQPQNKRLRTYNFMSSN